MNEIWVFGPGALGDTILTFPFLHKLQKKFSDKKIIFWGSAEYSTLVNEFFPSIEFRSFQSLTLLPIFSCDFSKQDLKINFPDRVFVILKKDKLIEKNLKEICPHVHWCEINEKENLWVGDQILRMLTDFKSDEFILKRQISANTKILIHMGTGSPPKLLPNEFWDLLIKHLVNSYSVTLLYGPAEKKIPLEKIEGVEIIQDVSLKNLIQKMKEFNYCIGLDSGVSHLAGVLGLKGYAFFHYTNPILWHPMGQIKPIVVDKNNQSSWLPLLNSLLFANS